ncbi:hypothetical protein D9611_000240 [Ephemerocybe angulata]|uniref:Ribonuclease H1 N-terminal domain-containing protein n=1 Tax=Ephemerocybe angulata TaxID=980116 RepID=A0A8H5BMA9_9AGAR|nr:hypothetical protein D9611_000240 [Tulosesus angulatus]
MPSARKNFYVVTKGRVPGIYDTWTEAAAQKDDLPDAIYEGFETYAQAREVWDKAVDKGWVKRCNPDAGAKGKKGSPSRRPLGASSSCSAIEDARTTTMNTPPSTEWYVVTRGIKPGVYSTWREASQYVTNVIGALYDPFESELEALRAFTTASVQGQIEVVDRDGHLLHGPPRYQPPAQEFTPPATPVKSEPNDFRLDHDYHAPEPEMAGMLGQMSISAAPSRSSDSLSYVTASPAPSYASPSATYYRRETKQAVPSPQGISQYHSLPATRLPSPERSKPIQRATSDRAIEDSTPRHSPSAHRTVRATVGAPDDLEDFPADGCRVLIPRNQPVLSPLSTSGISLRSVDGPRAESYVSAPSPRKSSSRTSTRHLDSPQAFSAVGSPSPVIISKSPSVGSPSVRATPAGSPAIRNPSVRATPAGSPATIRNPSVRATPAGSPATIRNPSVKTTPVGTPSLRILSTMGSSPTTDSPSRHETDVEISPGARRSPSTLSSAIESPSIRSTPGSEMSHGNAILTSPLPFDIRNGTSMFSGDHCSPRIRSRVASPSSPQGLGLTPAPSLQSVYEPVFDPRSPVSKKVSVPETAMK